MKYEREDYNRGWKAGWKKELIISLPDTYKYYDNGVMKLPGRGEHPIPSFPPQPY